MCRRVDVVAISYDDEGQKLPMGVVLAECAGAGDEGAMMLLLLIVRAQYCFWRCRR